MYIVYMYVVGWEERNYTLLYLTLYIVNGKGPNKLGGGGGGYTPSCRHIPV